MPLLQGDIWFLPIATLRIRNGMRREAAGAMAANCTGLRRFRDHHLLFHVAAGVVADASHPERRPK